MFSKSLPLRLSLFVCAAVVVLLVSMSFFIINSVGDRFIELNQSELEQLITNTEASVQAYNDELENTAEHLSNVFSQTFPGNFELQEATTVTVGNHRLPEMLSGNEGVSNNFNRVDGFAQATGGNATIFTRKGDDFVRVTTSVQKQDGSRAVGTLLDRNSPAYRANINGQSFTGFVELFGKSFITNYTPIKDRNGSVIGIRYIGIDFTRSLENLKQGFRSTRIGDNGYMFVVNTDREKNFGNLVLHPSNQNQRFDTAILETMLAQKKGTIEYAYGDDNARFFASYVQIPKLNWLVAASIPKAEMLAGKRDLTSLMILVTCLLIVAISALIVVLLRYMLAKPLDEVTQHLALIASGDYSQEIEINRKDEVGQVQFAMTQMQQRGRQMVQEIADTSLALASAASQLSEASAQVAHGSREQTESATSMASTMEELNASIESLSRNAEQAQSLSNDSNDSSQQGAQVIRAAGDAMQDVSSTVQRVSNEISGLGKLSGQISAIIQVIQEIADQTNLLALNAAIEAARAGEQGRGFAVVADEVRSLAARTSTSAQEITATIDQIQEGTSNTVESMAQGVEQVEYVSELAQQAGGAIEEIQSGSQQVVEVFTDISEMLREQALASTDVARNVDRIATMTEENTSAVSEVADAAADLRNMADDLNRLLKQFKIAS